MKVYLIGSLNNPEVLNIGNELRAAGHDVFDDWFAAGPAADDAWRDYERGRGRSYPEALNGLAARHTFNYDYEHLSAADVAVLVLPAGKSGHLEAGWARGRGKPLLVLLEKDTERYDVMYRFATGVSTTLTGILRLLDHLEAQARARAAEAAAANAQSLVTGSGGVPAGIKPAESPSKVLPFRGKKPKTTKVTTNVPPSNDPPSAG